MNARHVTKRAVDTLQTCCKHVMNTLQTCKHVMNNSMNVSDGARRCNPGLAWLKVCCINTGLGVTINRTPAIDTLHNILQARHMNILSINACHVAKRTIANLQTYCKRACKHSTTLYKHTAACSKLSKKSCKHAINTTNILQKARQCPVVRHVYQGCAGACIRTCVPGMRTRHVYRHAYDKCTDMRMTSVPTCV